MEYCTCGEHVTDHPLGRVCIFVDAEENPCGCTGFELDTSRVEDEPFYETQLQKAAYYGAPW